MSNELLYSIVVCIDIVFILFAGRKGLEWLYITIVANLLLITVFGAKLITLYGFMTNAGNIFYGGVFFATYIILELYGRQAAVKTISIGVVSTVFFVAIAYVVNNMNAVLPNDVVGSAIRQAFPYSFRIMCASLTSYIFAQYINIYIYEYVKKRTQGRLLWFRVCAATGVSQLIDSIMFSSLAFVYLPGFVLVQTIYVAWCIKVAVALLGTAGMYTFYTPKQI